MTRYVRPTYDFSLASVAGTVAAQNYLAIYNPSNSTRLVIVAGVFISFSCTVVGGLVAPVRGFRCNNVSGGVLQLADAIAKFDTTHPDPMAKIYTGNPSCTLGPAVFNSPTALDKRSSDIQQIDIPPGASPFTLRPGEGVVIRQETCTVGVYWNLSVVWAEAG